MKSTDEDCCVYTRAWKRNFQLAIMIYVDDVLIMLDVDEVLQKEMERQGVRLKMKDLGVVK